MKAISEDLLAALCIYAEARGEPYEGQVAVGEVLRTRTKLKFQSKGTVASTVLWPYAFSWLNTTDPERLTVFSADTDDPVFQQALSAWTESESTSYANGATSYFNPRTTPVTPKWATPDNQVANIGNHLFFLLR